MLRPVSVATAARHTQARKRSPTKDQARVENQIDDVRYPKQPHRDGCIAGAAENRVIEKQQQHCITSAQANSGIAAAGRDDLFRRPHQTQQVWRTKEAGQSDGKRDKKPESDRLHPRHCSAFRIFFADAPGYHGGR